MKRTVCYIIPLVVTALLLLILSVGCGSSPDTAATEEGTAEEIISEKAVEKGSAEAEEIREEAPSWVITVEGEDTVQLDGVTYLEMKEDPSLYKSITLERKGEANTYEGIPLWSVVGLADGSDGEGKTFNAAKWTDGYDITLTAADGYSVTFSTTEIPFNALYLVNTKDGEQVLPRIVGDAPGNLWIKQLSTIELGIKDETEVASAGAGKGPGADSANFELEVTIGGDTQTFSLEELEQSPYYTEGRGSFTTSAGTTYTHTYAGVNLADFLGPFFDLQPASTVTFVAMDGYEMSYSGETILDTSNGEWVLAFKKDGAYMPEDPGYIRTIKIGPTTPNIEGHLSVKMIKEIKVEAEGN